MPQAEWMEKTQQKVGTPPPLPVYKGPSHLQGRRAGQTRNPDPCQTLQRAFPSYASLLRRRKSRRGRGGRGVASQPRTRLPANRIPLRRGEHRLHAPSPPRPKSYTPGPSSRPAHPADPKQYNPCPRPQGGEGAGPRPRAFRPSPPRPFLHHRTRAGPASDRRD